MNSAEFYDKLAFDLIFADFAASCLQQGEIIDRLLRTALKSSGPFRILDCSCGIGTQAFGLAKLGHKVTGTDISPGAIRKAKIEAGKLGLDISFEVADMRSLDGVHGPFDAVLSFDNSLAHLISESDLAFALSSILTVLRPGGVFLCSLRDYDALKKERPTGTIPRRLVDSSGERIYLQTWDWAEDGRTYDLRLFLLKRAGESWAGSPLETKMRAYSRDEITKEIEMTPGFVSSEWLFPEATGYYQPVFSAWKG